jgi:hypothetical protein
MTTITIEKTELSRILDEGYGPGAWHGPDLKAALADVGPDLAFWRPAPERHNIAEITLHHAFTVRNVRAQLAGTPPEPFVLEGEAWFDPAGLTWPEIQRVLEEQQGKLAAVVAGAEPDAERFNLVLGITCHAIYHAGQVQLLKRLNG